MQDVANSAAEETRAQQGVQAMGAELEALNTNSRMTKEAIRNTCAEVRLASLPVRCPFYY